MINKNKRSKAGAEKPTTKSLQQYEENRVNRLDRIENGKKNVSHVKANRN